MYGMSKSYPYYLQEPVTICQQVDYIDHTLVKSRMVIQLERLALFFISFTHRLLFRLQF